MDEVTRDLLNRYLGVSAAQGCALTALLSTLDTPAAVKAALAFENECAEREANLVASGVTDEAIRSFHEQRDRFSAAFLKGRFGGLHGLG